VSFSTGTLGDGQTAIAAPPTLRVTLAACGTLLKPITWFAPMWAFGCGVVASGAPAGGHWLRIAAGIALAGPLVCGTSQAANDWFDRHVDAINEPDRPIPSGRVPGRLGLYIAIGWTALSLLVAALLGRWAFAAGAVGLALAWAYSAPPLRLKRNGWWGNAACGACYEGLPWLTGVAVMVATAPAWPSVVAAVFYSIGAHGIMTLNDFKSVAGDTEMGIRSLPVQLGVDRAAKFACIVMALPQFGVIALLLGLGRPLGAAAVALLLAVQLVLMGKLLRQPRERAPWYNATGTSFYVLGMMATAIALRGAL
jgi:chlorophyll synthase